MREIGPDQLEDMARGAGILGTGGGGDPYIGRLLAQQAIREHGPVTVVDIDEVPADATVIAVSAMGAPPSPSRRSRRATRRSGRCARWSGRSAAAPRT
nr:DUF917 family protein [Actinomadura sp. J1-007]